MEEGKIINKLLQVDERVQRIESSMLTKEDGEQIMTTLDHIVKIVARLDQERIFTTEWVRRIESEAERHRQEIARIKEALKIS